MLTENGYRPPEAEPKSIPAELTTIEELTDFWLTVWRNNGVPNKDPARERQVAAVQAKQTMAEMVGGNPAYFYGIKDGQSLKAVGKLEIRSVGPEKHGYQSSLAVMEKYRGQGLAQAITETQVAKAREHECTHLDADVFSRNAVGLVTKFNDGFALTGLTLYDETAGKFELSKRISGQEPEKPAAPEWIEAPLSDLKQIENYLHDGWIGVDLKNLGDVKDDDPDKWTVIFEK